MEGRRHRELTCICCIALARTNAAVFLTSTLREEREQTASPKTLLRRISTQSRPLRFPCFMTMAVRLRTKTTSYNEPSEADALLSFELDRLASKARQVAKT